MKYKIEQMKLLSDLVWGDELGRVDWIQSTEEWTEMIDQFGSNIITVEGECRDYVGNCYPKIVGLLVVAFPKTDMVQNEQAIIENEWYLSYPKNWMKTGPVCYLSEVVVHPRLQGSYVLKELIAKFHEWLKEHDVHQFYATGVTDEGCTLLEKFENAQIIARKADNRMVYRISIDNEKEE